MTFREATEQYLLAIESTPADRKNYQKRREETLLKYVLPIIGPVEVSEIYSIADGISEATFQVIRESSRTNDNFIAALDAMNAVLTHHFHHKLI